MVHSKKSARPIGIIHIHPRSTETPAQLVKRLLDLERMQSRGKEEVGDHSDPDNLSMIPKYQLLRVIPYHIPNVSHYQGRVECELLLKASTSSVKFLTKFSLGPLALLLDSVKLNSHRFR